MNIIIFIWLTALTGAMVFSRETGQEKSIRKLTLPSILPTEHAEFLQGNRVEEIFRSNPNATIDDILV